jgi:hypothetical protein
MAWMRNEKASKSKDLYTGKRNTMTKKLKTTPTNRQTLSKPTSPKELNEVQGIDAIRLTITPIKKMKNAIRSPFSSTLPNPEGSNKSKIEPIIKRTRQTVKITTIPVE